MAKAPLSSAEETFFLALQSGLGKTAELEDRDKLDPNTRLLLGIHESRTRDLKELEERASTYDEESRSPEEVDEEQRAVENDEVYGGAPAEELPEEPPQQVAEESMPPPVDEEPVPEPPPEELPPEQQEMVDEGMAEEELPPLPPPVPQPKPEPEPPGREQFGSLFSNRRAHPIVLVEVLRGRYGDDWVSWEPETLWWTIRRDFGAIGDLTRNKLMALRVGLQTGFPWTDWDIFENCGTAWNDHTPIFGAYQPLPPSEAAFTVMILKQLHPEFEFEEEINAYLGAVCEEAGLVYAPEEWFPGAQALIDRKDWVAPLRTDVQQAWSQVKKIPAEGLEEITFRENNAVDIHIGKLIAIREYLTAREAERKVQQGRQVRRVAVPTEASPVA